MAWTLRLVIGRSLRISLSLLFKVSRSDQIAVGCIRHSKKCLFFVPSKLSTNPEILFNFSVQTSKLEEGEQRERERECVCVGVDVWVWVLGVVFLSASQGFSFARRDLKPFLRPYRCAQYPFSRLNNSSQFQESETLTVLKGNNVR